MIKKIILASPRGICAGVDRAVQAVEKALDVFGRPVYVKHEIVHNKTIVQDVEHKGAVTIEDLKEVPSGSVVIFSAHGSTPQQYKEAKKKGLRIIDATCPLVMKVHLEVGRFFKKGYEIIYIGQKKHIEGIGVRAEGLEFGKHIPIVESVEDVKMLEGFEGVEKLIYLNQTTLNIIEIEKVVKALRQKYPQIIDPPVGDICYATTNRQKAIVEVAKQSDIVLVVGSQSSSNSKKMVERAKEFCQNSYLVDGIEDINHTWFEGKEVLGLSSGASAPESKVVEIVNFFVKQGARVEEVQTGVEKMKFKKPYIPEG